MGQMMGGFGAGALTLLWWLIGLGVLFFVIYEAVYLAVKRALREVAGSPGAGPVEASSQPPPESG